MDQHSKLFEELTKTSRAARKIDRERAELFAVLLRHPAWLLYIELLEAQIQARADIILTPAGSIEGAIVLEYVKGAMSGLILARDMPSTIIADMKSASSSGEDE
jgi:hypothetical protein